MLFLLPRTEIDSENSLSPVSLARYYMGKKVVGLYLIALLIIGLVLLWPTPPSAQADNFYTVTNTLDNGWDVSPPPGSLRAAMVAANNHGGGRSFITFNLPDSTVPAWITLQNMLPDIVVDMVITGPANAKLIISGDYKYRVIHVEGEKAHGKLNISNLTIVRGMAPDYGGGIFNHSSTVILNNMTLSDNHARSRGGGLMHDLGTTIINNSTFYANSVTAAAGGTSGDGGGAIYLHPYWPVAGSTMRIANSTFFSNSVQPKPGAKGNGGGGAILNAAGAYFDGTPVMGRLYLKNSVFAANAAPGGIGPDISSFNYYPTTTGVYTSEGYNFISNGSGELGDYNGTPPRDGVNGDHVGTDANPLNPFLGPVQDNGGPVLTMSPLPGSPLIDAGNPAGCKDALNTTTLAADARGFARAVDSLGTGTPRCDIGAYELQAPILKLNNGNVAYTPGTPPVFLNSATTTVADVNGAGFVNQNLSVKVATNTTPGDLLGLPNQGQGAGQVGVVGNVVSYGGVPIGTYSNVGGVNATLIINLTSPGVTTATVTALLTDLTFGTNQQGGGDRAIQFRLSDPKGAVGFASRTVAVGGCSATTVTLNADDGTGSQCGTLSYALNQPGTVGGTVITFNLLGGNVITLNGLLVPAVARNVTLQGGSCLAGPDVVINGNGKPGGLRLSGNDTLISLWIKGFTGSPLSVISTPGTGKNVLRCVKATKT